MRTPRPIRISTQIAVLVLGTVLLANAMATTLFLLTRDDSLSHNPAETTGRLAGLIEVLDRAPAAARPALLAGFAQSHPQFALTPAPPEMPPPASERERHLARALGPRFVVKSAFSRAEEAGALRHHITLSDGTTLSASEPRPARPPFLSPPVLSLLVAALCLLALLLWSGRKITRPLQAITRAAQAFRPEQNPVPLKETGPYEIRALAGAFNAMQQRIGELLTEKTNALAAVSHDLRTPITRMRLRAEFMADTAERARMIHDLNQMDQMTQSALDHLRAVATGTDREPVDLASLLHTLADRFQDDGFPVAVERAERLIARIRPLDLERALENLIENACKYADAPTLRLYAKGGEAVIEVEDRGPGIPPERHAELMQPFTRGDQARGMNETSGFGLGLAIAREAALRQGGSFVLLTAQPHGLLARITLPLAS